MSGIRFSAIGYLHFVLSPPFSRSFSILNRAFPIHLATFFSIFVFGWFFTCVCVLLFHYLVLNIIFFIKKLNPNSLVKFIGRIPYAFSPAVHPSSFIGTQFDLDKALEVFVTVNCDASNDNQNRS